MTDETRTAEQAAYAKALDALRAAQPAPLYPYASPALGRAIARAIERGIRSPRQAPAGEGRR